jgi:hypothetical protein
MWTASPPDSRVCAPALIGLEQSRQIASVPKWKVSALRVPYARRPGPGKGIPERGHARAHDTPAGAGPLHP